MKVTPSRWCGRSLCERCGSSTTCTSRSLGLMSSEHASGGGVYSTSASSRCGEKRGRRGFAGPAPRRLSAQAPYMSASSDPGLTGALKGLRVAVDAFSPSAPSGTRGGPVSAIGCGPSESSFLACVLTSDVAAVAALRAGGRLCSVVRGWPLALAGGTKGFLFARADGQALRFIDANERGGGCNGGRLWSASAGGRFLVKINKLGSRTSEQVSGTERQRTNNKT